MLTQRLPRMGSQVKSRSHPHSHATGLSYSWSSLLHPYARHRCLTSLWCGFYLQSAAHGAAHSLLPFPFCHRQRWAVCVGATLPLELHGAFPAQPFEVWTAAHVEGCPVETCHIQPVSTPNTADLKSMRWFQSGPWWARTKSMPYIKTKLDGSPRGRKYLLLGKVLQHVNFQFPVFLHIFQNS